MENLHNNTPIHRLCITKFDITYRNIIAYNLLCIISYRFVYLEPITVPTDHICRIIIPLSSTYYFKFYTWFTYTTDHMGEYKTLYRLKL